MALVQRLLAAAEFSSAAGIRVSAALGVEHCVVFDISDRVMSGFSGAKLHQFSARVGNALLHSGLRFESKIDKNLRCQNLDRESEKQNCHCWACEFVAVNVSRF